VDATAYFCWEFPERLFMGAEVVHDQVDPTPGPGWQHVLQPESLATFCRFCRKSFSDSDAGMGVECTKPLQGPISFVAIRTKAGASTPCGTSSRDGLQGTHFIKAYNLSPSGAVAVDLNYSVFFTSNSGSSLSHHVCPVKNRRPWRERMWRIVSRLIEEIPGC
jgi:hypothetical protein